MSETQDTPLLERLGSDQRATQRLACDEALAKLRQESGFRAELSRLLREGNAHARFAAAFVLFQERPTLGTLPALLDSLDLDDGDLRWTAAHMLATLGRMQDEVLPVLLHQAREGASGRRRRMLLYALRELAPEREETGRVLVAALDDPEPEVRRAALSSFARLTDPPRACVDRTIATLASDADPRMRRIAAVVLPELASRYPDAHSAARAALESAAVSGDPALSRTATLALRRLPSDDV